jgi:hypothetical protein
MKNKGQTRTGQILKVMPILAWLACFGFIVEAGAILISYTVSYGNPVGAKNLYNGLNLYDLRQFSFLYYSLSVSFLVALLLMKSWVAFVVARTLTKFNLRNPFTMEVARRLETISYAAFGTWIVTMLSNSYTGWLMKQPENFTGTFFPENSYLWLVLCLSLHRFQAWCRNPI